jgi:hypothetical protein
LTIRKGNVSIRIPVAFTKTARMVTQEDDSEEEYEDEELLEEHQIYLSDESDESELEYNPWSDMHSPEYSEDEILEGNDELELNDQVNPAAFC